MSLRFDFTRPAGAAVVFTVVAVAMTWPLASRLGTGLAADQGDPAFNCWVLAWTAGQLLRAAAGDLGALAQYWNGNIFHPEPLTLAYSEHLTAQALQILPIYAITGNILTAYNGLFIATFALSGWGMYLFARDLTGRPLAAFVAGLAFAYAPYRLGQFSHVQVLSSYWMPLVLLGLRRYFASDRLRPLAGGAAALVAQNLSCGYYLLFFAPFAAAYALYQMAVRRRLTDRRTWGHLAAAALAVVLLTLPFAGPYLRLREIRELGVRSTEEIGTFSADAYAFASIAPNSRLLGEIRAGYVAPEGEGFVGFTIFACALLGAVGGLLRLVRTTPWRTMADWHTLATALAAVLCLGAAALVVAMFVDGGVTLPGPRAQMLYRDASTPLLYCASCAAAFVALQSLARRRLAPAPADETGFFLAAAVIAALLALGPTMHALGRALGPGPYALLLEYAPGFDGLRVPARFIMLVACFTATLAGAGIARLLRWRRAGALVAAAAMAGMLAESWVAPLQMNQPVAPRDGLVVPDAPASGARLPAIYRLLRDLPDPVVLVELPFGDEAYEVLATFYAGHHRRPLVNGYSGFFPPSYRRNADVLADPLADPERAARRLRQAGATHVLLHPRAFAGTQGADLAAWLLSIGAARVAEADGDLLFALE